MRGLLNRPFYMLCFTMLIMDYIGELRKERTSPEKAHKLSVCLCPHPSLQVSTFVTVHEHSSSFTEYLLEILTDCVQLFLIHKHNRYIINNCYYWQNFFLRVYFGVWVSSVLLIEYMCTAMKFDFQMLKYRLDSAIDWFWHTVFSFF